jgi:hypothetical protein
MALLLAHIYSIWEKRSLYILGEQYCNAMSLFVLYADTNNKHFRNESYFKFSYGNFSYTSESPKLPTNDVAAENWLNDTAIICPSICTS